MSQEHDNFTSNIVNHLAETIYRLHNGEVVPAEAIQEYIKSTFMNADQGLISEVYRTYLSKISQTGTLNKNLKHE